MIDNLPTGFTLRKVADGDAEGLMKLIGGCFAEYDGVYLEPDGLDADLKAYATYLEGIGGEGYVLEHEGEIVALASCAPGEAADFQLKRIYLSASLRGTGLGPKLARLIEDRARARGAKSIELWSDSRFARAHAFYSREGYVKQGETRDLHDSSNTTEFHFIKAL